MRINIEGDYYITSDTYNIILSKLKINKKGEDEFKSIYYCPSVGHALKEYFAMKERTSKVTTFDGLMKLINENNKLMKEILERLNGEREGK